MRENIVKNKSFVFAIRIVKLYQFLVEDKKEYVLSKQLLRNALVLEPWCEKANTLNLNWILSTKWQ